MADSLDDLFDEANDPVESKTGQQEGANADIAETKQDESPKPEPTLPNGDAANASANKDDVEADDGMQDLFGDDEEQPVAPPQFTDFMQQNEGLSEEELAKRRRMEYTEDDMVYGQDSQSAAFYGQREMREAAICLVNYPRPQASDGRFWHVKLPNFLRIDHQPFDEHTFDEKDEDAANTINGKMIPDENVIRWRWQKDAHGRYYKQSNARLIRWSDGSSALQVGSEMFEVNAHIDNAGALSATAAGAQAPIQSISSVMLASSGAQGLTYLVAQHPYVGLSETHARVTGTMTFTPTNISSKAHRRLANAVVDRHAKSNKTKEIAFVLDPEKEREEKERKKVEESKKQGKASRTSRRRRGRSGRSLRTDDTDDDDDQDDEEEEDSMGRRREGRAERSRRSAYRDEDLEDDGFIVASEDEAGEEDGDGDGDEAAEGATSGRRGGDRTRADDLDAMEEAAERMASEKRKDKSGQAMDIDEAPQSETVTKRRMIIEDSD